MWYNFVDSSERFGLICEALSVIGMHEKKVIKNGTGYIRLYWWSAFFSTMVIEKHWLDKFKTHNIRQMLLWGCYCLTIQGWHWHQWWYRRNLMRLSPKRLSLGNNMRKKTVVVIQDAQNKQQVSCWQVHRAETAWSVFIAITHHGS